MNAKKISIAKLVMLIIYFEICSLIPPKFLLTFEKYDIILLKSFLLKSGQSFFIKNISV